MSVTQCTRLWIMDYCSKRFNQFFTSIIKNICHCVKEKKNLLIQTKSLGLGRSWEQTLKGLYGDNPWQSLWSLVVTESKCFCSLRQRSLTYLGRWTFLLSLSVLWAVVCSETVLRSVLLLQEHYLSGCWPDPVRVTFQAWRRATFLCFHVPPTLSWSPDPLLLGHLLS